MMAVLAFPLRDGFRMCVSFESRYRMWMLRRRVRERERERGERREGEEEEPMHMNVVLRKMKVPPTGLLLAALVLVLFMLVATLSGWV